MNTCQQSQLYTSARELGAAHGWEHADVCEAYGWAEHGGNVTQRCSPRQLLRSLIADISLAALVAGMTDADLKVLCLQVYGEYLAGFIDGIEQFEIDTHDAFV